MHSSTHGPEPDAEHEQPLLQSVRVQPPEPMHSMRQPLPAQDSVAGPDESVVTVHPPCGQEKVHGPLPSQRKWQPVPGHDRLHGEEVTHWHVCPGVQNVELLVAVVAMHATRAETKSATPSRPSMAPV